MITNRQLVLLLITVCVIGSASYIPGLVASAAGLGSWIPVMINSAIFGFAAFIIVRLNSKYNGKMLFEYSKEIIGKAGAYILGFLFIIYFLAVTEYQLISFTNTVRNNFLYNTPAWFELLLGIPVFGYAAYKGVRNIARMAEIVGVGLIIIASLIHIVMVTQGDIQNILPFYNPHELGKYLGAMKEAVIPYMGIEVLTVIPFAIKAKSKAPKVAFISVVVIGVIFVLQIESSIMMVGVDDIINYTDPLIVALRRIEITAIEFLSRLDITYLTIGFASFFIYLTIVYCAVVEYICKMFPRISRLAVVITVGAVLFILEFFISPIDNLRKVFGVYFSYAIPAASLGIPLLLTVISKVRKNAGKTN